MREMRGFNHSINAVPRTHWGGRETRVPTARTLLIGQEFLCERVSDEHRNLVLSHKFAQGKRVVMVKDGLDVENELAPIVIDQHGFSCAWPHLPDLQYFSRRA
jgi:hypothetical protein